MPTPIPPEVLPCLRTAECDGPHVRLTGQLDRKLYVATNKVLEALGGKWNRKAKAHVFDCDAAELIGDAVATGQYLDAKREFQFYETPEHLAVRMCELASVREEDIVLEPSAGMGAIAREAKAYGAKVHCWELQQTLADKLAAQGFSVVNADFLTHDPDLLDGLYDAVLMNPPFCRSQDIQHVRHAHRFLTPHGRLVAVMGAGVTFRQDAKARAFREWVDAIGGTIEPLPDKTFATSGTDVATVLVTINC